MLIQFFGSGDCGTRDFLNLMGLLAGIPTFALMTMRLNRPLHLLAVTVWCVFICAYFRRNLAHAVWRDVVLITVYHYIFAGAAYFRERSDRQLFKLKQEVADALRYVWRTHRLKLTAARLSPHTRSRMKLSNPRNASLPTVSHLSRSS